MSRICKELKALEKNPTSRARDRLALTQDIVEQSEWQPYNRPECQRPADGGRKRFQLTGAKTVGAL